MSKKILIGSLLLMATLMTLCVGTVSANYIIYPNYGSGASYVQASSGYTPNSIDSTDPMLASIDSNMAQLRNQGFFNQMTPIYGPNTEAFLTMPNNIPQYAMADTSNMQPWAQRTYYSSDAMIHNLQDMKAEDQGFNIEPNP